MHKLLIGIGTCDRPKMLSAALNSLDGLATPADTSLEVLVVDNSVDENASEIVLRDKENVKFPITYLTEPTKGLSSVRNRILNHAIDSSVDYLFCMDDDMTVTPDWLVNLYLTSQKYQADIVAGRVEFQLPISADGWLRKRDFFGNYSRTTGSLQSNARTGNVMIDINFIKEKKISFDLALNKIGGEDTHFFKELYHAGGKIVWCDEAVLNEEVPRSRANEEWILQRAYHTAFRKYKKSELRKGSFFAKGQALMYGSGQLFLFLSRWPLFPFLAKEKKVYWRRKLAKFYGSLAGILGKSPQEYAVIHGH